jgi:hypothetical protein
MNKYQFPPLKDEKTFEALINDLCKENFGVEFQVYGRKGQKQYGIDGLSFSKNEKQVVFQCKNKIINRDDKKIQNELLKDIEDEVKSASKKFTNIDTFIFANSFKQDTFLQDKAIGLSQQYGFSVIVWSWEEVEGLLEKHFNVAKQYYPELFDKTVLSITDIKQRFQENSLILLSSQNLYIENSFIKMPEIDKINDFIKSSYYENNLLVLTGKAGIGKTALLSKTQNNLIKNNIAFLSIKSDRFEIERKSDLLGFFGVENLLHSIKQIAKEEQIIILIDQLDALSLTMSSNKKVINLILEFIEQLKNIHNVKIIVSIREYDLKNDPLFKSLDDNNIIHTQLLDFNYIKNKLNSFIKESEKLNNTLIELLRTPLHLSIFIELYPDDNSCISIKTLQDLYNIFWKQKIQDKNITKLLYLLVSKMNELKRVEVSKIFFEDEFEDEISLLLSRGILKEESNKISFFHQTFYDYVFARDFAQKDISLYKYILTTSQDLNIREQFKQIIQFLRGTDEEKYLLELVNILYSERIRFHLKLLLISYLGSIEKPTKEEFSFLQKLFEDKKEYEKYFIESWISSDWLKYFNDIGFFTNENFQKYNLHSKLETFINKEAYLVLEILDKCDCESIKNKAIMFCLERLEKWDKYSFDIFQKYHHLIYENNLRYRLKSVYKKIYLFNQDYAIDLFFKFLNTKIEQFDNDNRKELLDHNWYEVFEFLIEQNEFKILQKLLGSIKKISEKFKDNNIKKKFLIMDTVFDSFIWQSDISHNSSWELYKKTLEKISQLAIDDKDIFLDLIKPYQGTRYFSLIAFLIFGYSKNPDEYNNEILKLLTNKELLEEISLNNDVGYKFASLLEKVFSIYDETTQQKIFNTIIQVNLKWEHTAFLGKWDKKAVYLGTHRGLKKYKLLSQLDIKDIKKFGYFKKFQELKRKFSWYKFKKPYKSRGGFIGTPLDTDIYTKMSLKNWLQSMKVFDGSQKRKKDFLKGDISQHSGRFEKEVADNPDKFYEFLFKLKENNIHPSYLSAGLNGLIASNYDEEKILNIIIHAYSEIDDKWLKRTILKAIKHLVNKNKFNDDLIDFLETNKDIRYEGIIKEKDKFQTIHDHMSSSINSFEGDFAELLPLVYKEVYQDKNSKNKILKLIDEVIDKNIDFVIFGLLRTLGSISSIDKILFKELLVKLIENDTIGQVSIYSLRNYHYLYINDLISKEQIIPFINKCISYVKLVEDKNDLNYIQNFGMYLFYYYLNEEDNMFKTLLDEAVEVNSQIRQGILSQIFEQELHSADDKKIQESKTYILKFKNDVDSNSFYTLDLTKMNGLGFIQKDFNFIKELSSSIHIKKEINSFIAYLQNEYSLDTTIAKGIFELLEELIKNIDSIKEGRYYDSKPLIEFILELNIRTQTNDKKKEVLDLIDKFLLSDTLRFNTKSAI